MLSAFQINKNYMLPTFPLSNQQNFEDFGKMLATSVFEFYQSTAVHPHQPMLIRWLLLLYVYK